MSPLVAFPDGGPIGLRHVDVWYVVSLRGRSIARVLLASDVDVPPSYSLQCLTEAGRMLRAMILDNLPEQGVESIVVTLAEASKKAA